MTIDLNYQASSNRSVSLRKNNCILSSLWLYTLKNELSFVGVQYDQYRLTGASAIFVSIIVEDVWIIQNRWPDKEQDISIDTEGVDVSRETNESHNLLGPDRH